MPNKTIYIKDADLPLFEQAQERLGESVSSVFAQFLRDRVETLTPDEDRLVELVEQIKRKRVDVKKERLLGIVENEYAAAQSYAEKALRSLRAGKVESARVFLDSATFYCETADESARYERGLRDRISAILKVGEQ